MPTPLGFPDPPDSTRLALVFNWMRQLATAIDVYLRGTGWTAPAAGASTTMSAPGVTGGTQWKKSGSHVTLTVAMTLTANVSDNYIAFTLPAAARPTRQIPAGLTDRYAFTPASYRNLLIGTDGTCRLTAGLSSGNSLYGTITYPVA